MTANEGYNIVKQSIGTRKIIACIEYKEYFLFSTVPNNYKAITDDQKPNMPLDSSFIINKNTKEVSVFNPLVLDVGDEYKIIDNYK